MKYFRLENDASKTLYTKEQTLENCTQSWDNLSFPIGHQIYVWTTRAQNSSAHDYSAVASIELDANAHMYSRACVAGA